LQNIELATGSEEEPAFSDALDDSSDVPIAIIKSHVISASQTITTGFSIHDNGSLHRSSAIEDTNFDPEEDSARDPDPVQCWDVAIGQSGAEGCSGTNNWG
jgi:hypothetical protein